MNLSVDDIDIYNDSAIILKRKTPKYLNYWLVILFLIIILAFVILMIPFNRFNNYKSYIVNIDNKFYINLLLDKSDFPVNKKNILYIKDKKYNYKINSLEENNLIIEVKGIDNLKIENNMINISILKERTTLLKILKKKIKKGFGL